MVACVPWRAHQHHDGDRHERLPFLTLGSFLFISIQSVIMPFAPVKYGLLSFSYEVTNLLAPLPMGELHHAQACDGARNRFPLG